MRGDPFGSLAPLLTAVAAAPLPPVLVVLGDDESGRLFELAPGDHAEVTQQTDLTGVMLVRALLRLRVPASTLPGLAWEASIIVDGTKLASMRATPGPGPFSRRSKIAFSAASHWSRWFWAMVRLGFPCGT